MEMRRQRSTLMEMVPRVLAIFILSGCVALDVMAKPGFQLEPVTDGSAFAKTTHLAPGDTLELAVHAKPARRLTFQIERIGQKYEHQPAEHCYDGIGGDAIADYPIQIGCPSSHIRRGWFNCRSRNGVWLASVNSVAECRWFKLRLPQPPSPLPPLFPMAGPQPAPVIQEFRGNRYVSFATWEYNVKVPIPEDCPNGFYRFVVFSPNGAVQERVPFVVEDRSAPAPVCFVASHLTAAAYNTAFGSSLYEGFDGDEYQRTLRASAVTMQRPRGAYYSHISPAVKFLERLNVPIRYTTTLSVHKDPTLLDGCRAIVLAFHPEYISARLRNTIVEAIERGVHLLSFSANAFYWRVELDQDPYGHDIMILDRAGGDQWRNQGALFSEQNIFGAQYITGAWGGESMPFVVEPRMGANEMPDPGLMSHWIFEGTGLRFGDRIADLMSGEIDSLDPSFPAPDVQEQIVFLSPYYNHEGKEFMAHTSYFMRPNGQMTFHSASLRFHHALASSKESGRKIQRMLGNILHRMLDSDNEIISKGGNKDSQSHLHDGRIWSNRGDCVYFRYGHGIALNGNA